MKKAYETPEVEKLEFDYVLTTDPSSVYGDTEGECYITGYGEGQLG